MNTELIKAGAKIVTGIIAVVTGGTLMKKGKENWDNSRSTNKA